jgi:hypothetical protein
MPETPHPYIEFERHPIWKVIDAAVSDLENNQDIKLTTPRPYVIGYLCQAVVNSNTSPAPCPESHTEKQK